MENIFRPIHILLLLGGYAFLMVGIAYLIRNYRSSKDSFLVAGRSVGTIESACSIAATWIWAPALFVAAEKAYTEGWVGVFWFVVPNILCLGIFAWFASRVRSMLPQGFTFSAFIQERFSPRCHNVYLFQFTALAICSFAVQILAGASVIKLLTGLPFLWGSILLSLVSLCYSVIIGLKISIVSDTLKMFLIFFIGLPLIIFTVINGGGLDVVKAGLGGISGGYTSLLSSSGIDVFLRFGLATSIGLIAGPFGDQAFWQRAFSTKKNCVGSSFLLSSLIFGVVPIAVSFLGFLAAGSKLNVSLVQNTNVFAINYFVGPAGVFLFLIILVASLIGTLDSRLSSVSSLFGHDAVQRWIPNYGRNSDSAAVYWGRVGMVLLVISGVLLANIPGIQILHLFLLYGQIRAATLLPTVMAIMGMKISERGVFWGITTSFLIGLPIFAWGNFNKDWHFIVAGSILTVLASGIITSVVTYLPLLEKKALLEAEDISTNEIAD